MDDETPSRPPRRVATTLSHAGRDPSAFHGFINPPVVHASTVLFPSVAANRSRTQRYTYGIHGTPTTDALCDLMNALEGSEGTALTSSGLSACTIALASAVKAGDRALVTDNVYMPTRRFSDSFLTRFGVEIVYFDPRDHAAYEAELAKGAAAVFLEAPGSLTFEMSDIPFLAATAKAAGAVSMIDNTWATPLFFRPLEHGVDLSIHAATKYLSGHSDLLFGTISGNGQAIANVRKMVSDFGENVGPDDVYAVMRGIRSLKPRMAQVEHSARKVAEWLDADRRVGRVLYPALPGAPGHALWKRDFTGASGLFAITFKGRTEEEIMRFVDSLEIFGIGASWGGFESLATMPKVNAARSATRWPEDEPLVRLNIGLEDPDDLIADLDQAMAHL